VAANLFGVLEKDEESREVTAPDDLLKALGKNAVAKKTWSAKTPTFRKEYVAWIEDAKTAETRARRIAKAVEKVANGERRQ
jgi:uncharacterized protein YdeI (YjbR/CyaY-like superfamily)